MRLRALASLTFLSILPLFGMPQTRAETVRPEVVCAPDPSGAKLAVELAFAELQRLHRARVPGPTGQSLIAQRTDKLLARFVHFTRFVDDALGEAWNEAPERRHEWESTISDFLKRRYLDRLGSPLGSRIAVGKVAHDCDEARVSIKVVGPDGRKSTDVEIRMVLVAARLGDEQEATSAVADFGPSRWRAFDVSVDGASLLELWKGRFRRVFADGGVAAIEEHLRNLSQRKAGRDEVP